MNFVFVLEIIQSEHCMYWIHCSDWLAFWVWVQNSYSKVILQLGQNIDVLIIKHLYEYYFFLLQKFSPGLYVMVILTQNGLNPWILYWMIIGCWPCPLVRESSLDRMSTSYLKHMIWAVHHQPPYLEWAWYSSGKVEVMSIYYCIMGSICEHVVYYMNGKKYDGELINLK